MQQHIHTIMSSDSFMKKLQWLQSAIFYCPTLVFILMYVTRKQKR